MSPLIFVSCVVVVESLTPLSLAASIEFLKILSQAIGLPNGAYELIIKKREKRRKREEKERKREERKKRRREGWLKRQYPSKQRERG